MRISDWSSDVCSSDLDRDVLVAAGIEGADAVVAVTSGDNSNVVIARTAREAYEVQHVVARIYDPARARIYERLGIPTVATARWTIDQVLRHVVIGRASCRKRVCQYV